MKFQLLLFVFALNLGGGLVRAQVECVFLPTEQEDKSPELLEKHLEFEKLWQLGANDESQRRAVEFIPVVIHIIHDQGIGDISDAQVLKAIDFLNQGFSNQGEYYHKAGTPVEIQFCLAEQDPQGQPTSGITRTNSSLSTLIAEEQDAKLKNLIHWDASCYANVYIVNEIISSISGRGVLGYANGPILHGSPLDGLVVESALTGRNPENTSTLIHEMGHYLGLLHTFEGGCKNDDCMVDGDKVCDTPPDASTAPVDCNQNVNTCTTDTRSGFTQDQPDQVINFMDYGSGLCKIVFTQGQKSRMKLSLSNLRKSLLFCSSCLDPCPNPVDVRIVYDSLNSAVSIPFHLRSNTSQGAYQWEWYDNGILISSTADFFYPFYQEGKHTIKLVVKGNDAKCIFRDSIMINVNCNIDFIHNLRDTFCIPLNSILPLYIMSQDPGHTTTWYIDGNVAFIGDQFNWQNTKIGTHKIHVVVENKDCKKSTNKFIYTVGCIEICGNLMDDDGDELIDGFDPDCCDEINDFYFDPCDESCPRQLKNSFASIKTKWRTDTSYNWFETNIPYAGDIDNDGNIEIIGCTQYIDANGQKYSNNVIVLDGKTGTREALIPITGGTFARSIGIADVDQNGYGDIFSSIGFLERIEYLGNSNYVRKYRVPIATYSQQPSFADFNQDGVPEIYINNAIWNAVTGVKYIDQDLNKNLGKSPITVGNSGSIAVDILPDNMCPTCDGLELVTANQVYAVDLNINTPQLSKLTLVQEVPNEKDGYSAIADFDLDGDQDAFVISTPPGINIRGQVSFYVWDVQTNNVISPRGSVYSFLGSFATPAIGYLNTDNSPDVVFNTRDSIYAFAYSANQWSRIFQIANMDMSGMAGLSVYDFNGDGRDEVLIRNEQFFWILNGETGAIIFSYPCPTGTGYEYPTVADIDGDLEAELLFSCDGQLICLEAAPGSWTFTRPVWNQLIYNNVNVNDDLTIPQYQQKSHLPQNHNKFLNQYSYLQKSGSDIAFINSSTKCSADSLILHVSICNQGPSNVNDSLYISVFDQNPFSTSCNLIARINSGFIQLGKDSCKEIILQLIKPLANQVFLVLNTQLFSVTPFPPNDLDAYFVINECNYRNNLFVIQTPQDPIIDLGPDKQICDFESVRLVASPEFSSYKWIDGSIDSIFTVLAPGTYWVEVQDQCGNVVRDSITFTLLVASKIELGHDIEVCKGDSLTFTVQFQQLLWKGNFDLNCDTCNTIHFLPDSSGKLEIYGKYNDHCYSYDSINIFVKEKHKIKKFDFLCRGESISINGVNIDRDSMLIYSYGIGGACDTIVEHFISIDTSRLDLGNDKFICPGNSVQLSVNLAGNVKWRNSPDLSCLNCPNPFVSPTRFPVSFFVTVTTDSMCIFHDSILLLELPTSFTKLDKTICEGDSIRIGKQWIKNQGIYADSLQNTYSCDSIVEYQIRYDNSKLELPDFLPICEGDSISFQLTGFLDYNWENSADIRCDTCAQVLIKPSNTKNQYILNALTQSQCWVVDTLTLDVLSAYQKRDTFHTCNGDSVFWFGKWRKPGQVYLHSIKSQLSCDSLYYLHLITFPLAPVDLGGDKKQCKGDILNFSATGSKNRIWQSNVKLACDTCLDLKIICEQNQWLQLSAWDMNNCLTNDSIWIEVKPSFHDFREVFLCSGDSIKIGMQWIKEPLTYTESLESVDNCDSLLITHLIFYTSILPKIPDTIYAIEGESLKLNYLSENEVSQVLWTSDLSLSCDNCIHTELVADRPGMIHLVVQDKNGCEQEFDLVVLIKQENFQVFIPNVFSPNGDQLNDFLDIYSESEDIFINHIQIFDRWGELVYETKEKKFSDYIPWDGTFRSKDCPVAVYVLDSVFTLKSGKKLKRTTDIQLIR